MSDDIQITPLDPNMLNQAASVLAEAFVTNPLHIAAFGAGQLERNGAFFRTGLKMMRGPKHVAMDGSRMVGVIHWVDSPGCEFSPLEKLALMPTMLMSFGPTSAMKVGSWLAAWEKDHPKQPHCHLGPIGVLPKEQGRKIGHRLMETYCQYCDSKKIAGYLETDRPENVAFYQRYAFKVTKEIDVIGVKNFLMWRECKSA